MIDLTKCKEGDQCVRRDGETVPFKGPRPADDYADGMHPDCHWVVGRVLYRNDGTLAMSSGDDPWDIVEIKEAATA